MPIREESFRIGCGRYLQRAGILEECAKEILHLGKAPLVIGGKTALSLIQKTIEQSLQKEGLSYRVEEHRGTCNEERAKELASLAKEECYDVIVGVGGGVLMDFAKLVAFFADLPVINIPTSSATCAAFTPLSVCYTPDGRTVGTKHFPQEVSAVLMDSNLLAAQPVRLLLAGVFDALAKYLEIKHRFYEGMEEYPLGLDWAYTISKKSFEELAEKTEKAIASMKEGQASASVEQVLFTAVAVTGVISGIARGSNQTALAHKFYEITRTLYFEQSRSYLHGEIVGVGLLLQNHFNAQMQYNEFLQGLMKKYQMPSCLREIGLCPNEKMLEQYYEKLKKTSSIDEQNEQELQRLREGLQYLFQL